MALIQNTLAAVVGGQGAEVTVFSVAAVFGVVIEKLADKLRAERTLGNFESAPINMSIICTPCIR